MKEQPTPTLTSPYFNTTTGPGTRSVTSSQDMEPVYLCFNPFCSQPLDRCARGRIGPHEDCLKWVVNCWQLENQDTRGVVSMEDGAKQKKPIMTDDGNSPRTQIPILNQPLHTILTSTDTKSHLQSSLSTLLTSLKQNLLQKITSAQNYLKQIKIQSYFQKMNKLEEDIRAFVLSYRGHGHGQGRKAFGRDGGKIGDIVGRIGSCGVLREVQMVFMGELVEIQARINKCIADIPKYIFCSQQSLRSDITLPTHQSKSLQSYLFNPQDDHNRKMSKLSTLLKSPPKLLYQKKNPDLIVKCQFCPTTYSSQKRRELMNIWDNLCGHLLDVHQGELGYLYGHLVGGGDVGLSCVEEVVYKMVKYQYQALEIIYKSGRKFYTFSHTNRKKLSIDILLKGQTSHLPLKHIYISQPHEFFSIVSTIAYHLQKSLPNPKPIDIFVSNPIQKIQVKKLSDLFNLTNVNVVGGGLRGRRVEGVGVGSEEGEIVEEEDGDGGERDRERDRERERERKYGSYGERGYGERYGEESEEGEIRVGRKKMKIEGREGMIEERFREEEKTDSY